LLIPKYQLPTTLLYTDLYGIEFLEKLETIGSIKGVKVHLPGQGKCDKILTRHFMGGIVRAAFFLCFLVGWIQK
jgi:hypothetical protein